MTTSVLLYRIASETRKYKATDLSGGGAAAHPGRWNAVGEHVVYAAKSRSMAVLETAAHIDDAGLPQNRFLIRIDVPLSVWRARKTFKASQLDPLWCAIPAGKTSEDVGSDWFRSKSSALLLVPSVIVPEELVVVINATHPSAKQLNAVAERVFEYDKLFR